MESFRAHALVGVGHFRYKAKYKFAESGAKVNHIVFVAAALMISARYYLILIQRGLTTQPRWSKQLARTNALLSFKGIVSDSPSPESKSHYIHTQTYINRHCKFPLSAYGINSRGSTDCETAKRPGR